MRPSHTVRAPCSRPNCLKVTERINIKSASRTAWTRIRRYCTIPRFTDGLGPALCRNARVNITALGRAFLCFWQLARWPTLCRGKWLCACTDDGKGVVRVNRALAIAVWPSLFNWEEDARRCHEAAYADVLHPMVCTHLTPQHCPEDKPSVGKMALSNSGSEGLWGLILTSFTRLL